MLENMQEWDPRGLELLISALLPVPEHYWHFTYIYLISTIDPLWINTSHRVPNLLCEQNCVDLHVCILFFLCFYVYIGFLHHRMWGMQFLLCCIPRVYRHNFNICQGINVISSTYTLLSWTCRCIRQKVLAQVESCSSDQSSSSSPGCLWHCVQHILPLKKKKITTIMQIKLSFFLKK